MSTEEDEKEKTSGQETTALLIDLHSKKKRMQGKRQSVNTFECKMCSGTPAVLYITKEDGCIATQKPMLYCAFCKPQSTTTRDITKYNYVEWGRHDGVISHAVVNDESGSMPSSSSLSSFSSSSLSSSSSIDDNSMVSYDGVEDLKMSEDEEEEQVVGEINNGTASIWL
jgi:hypothetical protein